MHRTIAARAATSVLIVGPAESARLALRRAIQATGFTVRDAADAETACSLLAPDPPDLLLLDRATPARDALMAACRQHGIPVLLVRSAPPAPAPKDGGDGLLDYVHSLLEGQW